MENFQNFELNNSEIIFGGEFQPTYVGLHGDIYDTATGRYVFFLE